MYALTGGSGQLGQLVIRHLLQRVPAAQIIVTTRTPQNVADLAAKGIAVRYADFTAPATLPAAFAGATRLLIISTNDTTSGARVEQHQAAITAAVAAGVSHIVYTSFVGASATAPHPISRDHGLTENALAVSGVGWTALRNNIYSEGLMHVFGPLVTAGQLILPEGDAKTSWVTRNDCARTAAAMLAGVDTGGNVIPVTGPEALSLQDIAERLRIIQGGTMPVRTMPDAQLIEHFVTMGLPQVGASAMVGFMASLARSGYAAVADTIERVTGSPAEPVDEVLRSLVNEKS